SMSPPRCRRICSNHGTCSASTRHAMTRSSRRQRNEIESFKQFPQNPNGNCSIRLHFLDCGGVDGTNALGDQSYHRMVAFSYVRGGHVLGWAPYWPGTKDI